MKRIADVKAKTPIEKLREEPRTCCFYLKYVITFVRYYLCYGCKIIVSHPAFEFFVLAIICANCLTLALNDPTDGIIPHWHTYTNSTFQIIYTVELVMKILGLGLVIPQGAFLRDWWNIADSLVVIFGYIDLFNIEDTDFDPRPLRIFRVFRPFRDATGIDGVKSIMVVLSASLPLLFFVALVYVFYLAMFAIIGVQLWHDSFNVRCKNEATQEFNTELFCGYYNCPQGYTCSYYNETLGNGRIDFDNFFHALLMMFIVSTNEGGPVIQKALIEVEGYYVVIYFTAAILVGFYFLKHFILGVFQYNLALLYASSKQAIEEKPPEVTTEPLYKHLTLKPPPEFRLNPEFDLNRSGFLYL